MIERTLADKLITLARHFPVVSISRFVLIGSQQFHLMAKVMDMQQLVIPAKAGIQASVTI